MEVSSILGLSIYRVPPPSDPPRIRVNGSALLSDYGGGGKVEPA